MTMNISKAYAGSEDKGSKKIFFSFVLTDSALSWSLQSYLNVISKAIEGVSMEMDGVGSLLLNAY